MSTGQAPTGSTGQEPSNTDTQQGGGQDQGQEPTPNATTTTQPDEQQLTPEAIAEVRREAAKYRTRAQAAEAEVQKFQQAQMTEQERQQATLKTAEQTAAEATLRADRLEVAMAKALPAEALEFLHGSTKEELEANADKLKQMLGTPEGQQAPPPAGIFDSGARGGGGQPQDMSALIRAAAGR